jgi:hypothetical protein
VIGGRTLTADLAVLADDDAIITHAPRALVAGLLVERPMAAILTQRSGVPRHEVSLWPGRQVTLLQRGRAGVLALVGGESASVHERLGASLRPAAPLARAGESRFTTLATVDAAPVFGSLGDHRALLIAGFGPAAAFFAPAIARAIVGEGSAGERAWFAAHGPGSGSRPNVTDHPAFAA